jgi:alpha-N-arabinofuranosidase
MVNVIAPIFTEKGGRAIRQTIFYPFAMAAQYCTGAALRVFLKAPVLESAAYGDVPSVACAAAWDEGRRELAVLCVNISCETQAMELDLRSFGSVHWIEHRIMEGDLSAVNTFDAPDRVIPRSFAAPGGAFSIPEVSLPPKSFHLMRFKV